MKIKWIIYIKRFGSENNTKHFAYLFHSCQHQLWTPSEDSEEDPNVCLWNLSCDAGLPSGCIWELCHTLAIWRYQQPVLSQK